MKKSRREFLKTAGCGLGAITLASQINRFGMVNALAAAAPSPDYKALVMIFLAGGNDGNNTVIPNFSNSSDCPSDPCVSDYSIYSAGRGGTAGLAIAQSSLSSTTITPMSLGLNYSFHPTFANVPNGYPGIHQLFGDGRLAVVTNVGTLIDTLTKPQYINPPPGIEIPQQLFSHSDQIEQAQTCVSNGNTSYRGWGGRISNLMTPNPPGSLPMLTSISGSQTFIIGNYPPLVVGETSLQTIFSLNHTQLLYSVDPAYRSLIAPSPTPVSPLVRGANEITQKALDADSVFNDPLNPFEVPNPGRFPETSLGKQLLQVARIIKASASNTSIGGRQIFFCQIGGFDTHAYQLPQHAVLLTQLSQAMRAFWDTLSLDLGLEEKVVTFTMSDFSRTLMPNGTGASAGSDHAWANHMLVMGGPVKGGDFYGYHTGNGTPFPDLRVAQDGPQDTENAGGRGRWIPTTGNEEYAYTLAKWFGLPKSQRHLVFPNLPNLEAQPRSGNIEFLNE